MNRIWFVFLFFCCSSLSAQIVKPIADSTYYNFWEGTWVQEVNGTPDTTLTRFVVKKSVHPYAFEEKWRMGNPKDGYNLCAALRAWDKVSQKWMFTWVDQFGRHQNWDYQKLDSGWYMFRRFNINGDKYLSRMTWIPLGNERVVRISQKSYDEGKTWQLRFKEYFRKAEARPSLASEALQKTIFDYLNGVTEGDTLRVKNTFHTSASIKYVDFRTGKFVDVPIKNFINGLKPGAGKKLNRTTKLLSVNLTGTAAQASVHIAYKDFSLIEYLNLLSIDGEWKIVSKIFYR